MSVDVTEFLLFAISISIHSLVSLQPKLHKTRASEVFRCSLTFLSSQCGTCFVSHFEQWRTQEFCSGGGSTNSVEDRENGDLGAVAPSQEFWRQL